MNLGRPIAGTSYCSLSFCLVAPFAACSLQRAGLTTMQWLRSRLRLGSCVALFALAVQLVLTFGHVHLDGAARYSSITIEASAGATTPASTDRSNGADDYCALCALAHLAGTLLLPASAALSLPAVIMQLRHQEPAPRIVLPASPSAPFAARAPPLA
jgi:hypothetical protein